jgi:hypothetical protein
LTVSDIGDIRIRVLPFAVRIIHDRVEFALEAGSWSARGTAGIKSGLSSLVIFYGNSFSSLNSSIDLSLEFSSFRVDRAKRNETFITEVASELNCGQNLISNKLALLTTVLRELRVGVRRIETVPVMESRLDDGSW